jgi:hypothetical protein
VFAISKFYPLSIGFANVIISPYTCVGVAKKMAEKIFKNFLKNLYFSIDANRICSTIALLNGQANDDVAWPLLSLEV